MTKDNNHDHLRAVEPPPPRDGLYIHIPRRHVALVGAIVLFLAFAGGGYALGSAIASPGTPAISSAHAAASSPMEMPSASPAASSPSDGSSSSPLGMFIGEQMGTALAGTAPQTVDAAQVLALGNGVPFGASVDEAANRITLAGAAVSFTVEAVPPNNPDMTFRIAGLVDPTVVVTAGAQVTVEFVNADTDEAHGWEVIGHGPPFAFSPGQEIAIPGATAGLIGDPTPAGSGARIITFQAGTPGAYQYVCPVPGHAQMGMHGGFIVAPAPSPL